jgi:hypothetical protein
MKRYTSVLAAISVLVFVSGCATQASLTVSSQPDGAYITEIGTGAQFGMAPVSIVYNPSALEQNKTPEGCYLVKGVEARWISGAVSSIDPIILCGSPVGRYNIDVKRDGSYPCFEKDLQFVVQVQSLRAQQRLAEATEDAAAATEDAAAATENAAAAARSAAAAYRDR